MNLVNLIGTVGVVEGRDDASGVTFQLTTKKITPNGCVTMTVDCVSSDRLIRRAIAPYDEVGVEGELSSTYGKIIVVCKDVTII